MEDTHTTTTRPAPFTASELTDIARDAFGAPRPTVIEWDPYRYTFTIEQDDMSGFDLVNDCDGFGRLEWGRTDRNTGYDVRPDGFDGAARKLHVGRSHDTIWWQPYRDESGIYDDDQTRRLVIDILEYGCVGCAVMIERRESCGHWHEIESASLWGIESPLVGAGNYEYLAEVFADLVADLTTGIERSETMEKGL